MARVGFELRDGVHASHARTRRCLRPATIIQFPVRWIRTTINRC
ncbi:hypothetical protein DIQ79_00710 [Mycolicibacterium smegmatis]|uniref:Uncharacterized protein n=1 Tax=Mycolicibacterium smegmatis (strain ATCC 700084 / mc(2)155) TaxID=246196 RepID=A0R7A7_MYCS2|nr:hypothetical protein MSMEG_6841 [Mycolicibacterium smegmatis MC2 155]TBM53464.1 hypothetical protein DIQ86_00655 [Mycolicibacterium smegmatis]TBH51912.1 hypothetical protein EYS45_00750 [Mycolicibacterium smegmatis MC2 155]TBM57217.1 hypothetical protein DIQ85_00710 [Mycolicibacterium smegmatis]TBM67889.1 hypothetical protein DIQ83_00750 [Mycolicibacterium smegmatis]